MASLKENELMSWGRGIKEPPKYLKSPFAETNNNTNYQSMNNSLGR